MVPWNSARTKVQIKLSIQRLRTLQEKKLALAKKARREIADLLQRGRAETCRLRVEGLIQDDIYVELLEVMELYAETLQARFGLLDASIGETPGPSIADAVCAIIYAAPRTELKELQILREMLMHKFGRQFSLALQPSDPPPSQVPTRVLSRLAVFVPPKELVDAYLGEIAKGYGISWSPPPSAPSFPGPGADRDTCADAGEGDGGEDGVGGSGGGGGGVKEGANQSAGEEKDAQAGEGKNASAVPAPPAGPEKDAWASSGNSSGGSGGAGAAANIGGGGKKLTEDEELAARFERLQRLK